MSAESPVKLTFTDGATLDQLLPANQRAEVMRQVSNVAMAGLVSTLQCADVLPQLAGGAVLYAGEFVINIANSVHRIHYELVTTRALLAGEVFNEAIQFVDAMKQMGKWEPEVADITTAHLYRRLGEILG